MSLTYALDSLELVYRPDTTPHDAPIGTKGDVVHVHCVGGVVKEVDPALHSCRDASQCFLCGDDGAISPVKRDSWLLNMADPRKKNPDTRPQIATALDAYQRKSGIVSRYARMVTTSR